MSQQQISFNSGSNPEIVIKININPTFSNLIRQLTEEEELLLLNNLINNGCRDPIIVDELYQVLDGHNRFNLCSEKNISFNIVQLTNLVDEKEKMEWIINNQLSRRNLTPEEKKILIGEMYLNQKQTIGTNQYSQSGTARDADPLSTAQKIAQKHNVKERFIYNAVNYVTGMELIKHFFNKFEKNAGNIVYNGIKNGKDFILNQQEIQYLAKFKNDEMEEDEIETEMKKIYDKFMETEDENPDEKLKKLKNRVSKKGTYEKEEPSENDLIKLKENLNNINYKDIIKTSPIDFKLKTRNYMIKIQDVIL